MPSLAHIYFQGMEVESCHASTGIEMADGLRVRFQPAPRGRSPAATLAIRG